MALEQAPAARQSNRHVYIAALIGLFGSLVTAAIGGAVAIYVAWYNGSAIKPGDAISTQVAAGFQSIAHALSNPTRPPPLDAEKASTFQAPSSVPCSATDRHISVLGVALHGKPGGQSYTVSIAVAASADEQDVGIAQYSLPILASNSDKSIGTTTLPPMNSWTSGEYIFKMATMLRGGTISILDSFIMNAGTRSDTVFSFSQPIEIVFRGREGVVRQVGALSCLRLELGT